MSTGRVSGRVAGLATWMTGALGLFGAACGASGTPTEVMAPDAAAEATDLCGAFTAVGAPCPRAGPTRCFPMCLTGGCFCRAGAGAPIWACTTDTSCLPPCVPLDDACAATGSAAEEGGLADAGDDGGSE